MITALNIFYRSQMDDFNFNDAMKLSRCDDECDDKGFNISNFLVMIGCEEKI